SNSCGSRQQSVTSASSNLSNSCGSRQQSATSASSSLSSKRSSCFENSKSGGKATADVASVTPPGKNPLQRKSAQDASRGIQVRGGLCPSLSTDTTTARWDSVPTASPRTSTPPAISLSPG